MRSRSKATTSRLLRIPCEFNCCNTVVTAERPPRALCVFSIIELHFSSWKDARVRLAVTVKRVYHHSRADDMPIKLIEIFSGNPIFQMVASANLLHLISFQECSVDVETRHKPS